MTLDNNQDVAIIAPQLEEIVEALKNLENQKEQICEEIQNIFTAAKLSGFDNDILKEILEIHKVQNEFLLRNQGISELYNNLLKWKNINEDSSRLSL